MPKTDVDYSNTIIYKIVCKDESIKDVYVGHTTNFIQRKYSHKMASNNLKNNLKIYNTIRCTGGWDNWDMIEIAKYSCKDSTEARIKEQQHYEVLKATLKMSPPYVDVNNSVTEKSPKVATNHFCKLCNYLTSKLSDYNKHILTDKHKSRLNVTNETEMQPFVAKNLYCVCGISFNNRTTLWRHKKKCDCKYTNADDINIEDEISLNDKDLIIMLLKQNAELIKGQQDMMVKLTENGINNNSHNTTNSHNKAFNLNLFLNETCKDAMNITDFVDSIKLQLSDLEKIGEVGYTQGISNIITTNLKALDVTQRPVHCTDKKRGIMYIKDENKWEKEDEDKTKLKHLIIRVSNKNIKLLPQFREKYPDYKVSSSRTSDKYDKIVLEAMGGSGDNDKEKTEKIIKNISNATILDKYNNI
jgi:predicted GIY-YIG superfamily endonuclease